MRKLTDWIINIWLYILAGLCMVVFYIDTCLQLIHQAIKDKFKKRNRYTV